MKNQKIRLRARGAGVPLWRIAEAMGISEPTFFRKLRHQLPPEEEEAILQIIEALKGENE